MHQTDFNYTYKELPSSLKKYGILFFIVGLFLAIVAFFVDRERAIFNYLVLYAMLVSIGLGSLFLVALEYITNADWSVPFRRIPEFLSGILPLLFILVIPLLIFNHDLFHWTHKEVVEQDPILKGKEPYLNMTFFVIRVIAFISIWILFYWLIGKNSFKQDETKDQNLTRKNIVLSAVFVPIFAITITFTSIDWLMSLEPHWFSTIFGVYYFSGTVIAALSVVTLIVVHLKEKGYYSPWISEDHLYSFGALLFGFVNFWAYIAFSQFLLIWYANLPEETFWYLTRWEGSWSIFSVLLILVHFVVPYAVLLSQPSKMDPKKLKFISIWLLFAHLLDLFWLVMPNMSKMKSGYYFSWIDLVFPVLGIGIVMIVFHYFSKNKNLIPVGDPKLQRGLNFHL
ncbi:MAG: quinol:cytochrome C oxidoreductase [Ignavibacterium sp.]|nr:quinol:cytochrome C oxidoreductase [Ignavibacterium sp.]MDW8375598.1 quinol:cytochrome C oxidoreductase [Ignavibacteriales bacterium]